MEDELEVDIEGDEFDTNKSEHGGAGLVQEQLLQSAWSSDAGILPWELDNTISDENREAIQRMLLEEQYYLKGQEIPGDIWSSDANSKPNLKKSQAKTASFSSSRWSKQEKDLFEEGLAQFGRRWTKIARLVRSRTVLQVKSYARQYFKHKAKLAPVVGAPSTGPTSSFQPAQPTSSCTAALANTVRIERLLGDEDEEVDITDDDGNEEETECQVNSPPPAPPPCHLPEELEDDERDEEDKADCKRVEEEVKEQEEVKGDEAVEGENDDDDDDDDDEEEELKAPEQEVVLDTEIISEDEKQAIPEFFEGRPSKTPERYLKIRNYILDQWLKSKPKYLNKTSVRPGLKNCGDVNCIGRIHTYLELIGAINFNCEQAVYNRPRVVDRCKHKEGKDVLEAYQLAQRLQSMRTRKRRVRDMCGNWCDAKHMEGQTYEHLSAEELALRRERLAMRPKACKTSRHKGSFDPFQLIPCRSFGEDVQEPFRVIVCAETLLIMDMHAHVSRGEVIGLLGGTFNEDEKELKICAAEPCNSVSTGLQCDMDPLSQTQACDVLSSLGFSVVGWYHSHPSFQPNPSVRDIDTQDQFQSYFSRGGAPFIGMIVSPYDPANPSPHSQTTCLLVKESQEPFGMPKLPYKFDFLPSQDIPDWDQTLRRALWIIQKYSQTPGSVHMDRFFRRGSHLTCLEKMLSSMARSLEPLQESEGDAFLTHVHSLFLSDFIAKQQQESGPSMNDLTSDGDEESGQRANAQQDAKSETDNTTVLHLGSVLSTEHDYLL
ncbi:histone H2A deubiquitinase MYSM1 isoform X1 [Nerophis lumbriciformis]|uniref:histone H2A deubiquitinase MYSM1 isoform X1 n=1 Tax=Nerophis lumbriciformis TaxID=546530 RepID=UPI003BAC501A